MTDVGAGSAGRPPRCRRSVAPVRTPCGEGAIGRRGEGVGGPGQELDAALSSRVVFGIERRQRTGANVVDIPPHQCVDGGRWVEPQCHGAQRHGFTIGDDGRPAGDALGNGFEKREVRLLIQQIGIDDHAEHGTDPEDETRGLVFRSGIRRYAAKTRERRLVADDGELNSGISSR